MTWEIYTNTAGRKPKRGAIAILYKGGLLAITQEVKDMLDADFVMLAYNSETNEIGLIPSEGSHKAFKIRKKRGSLYHINIKSFAKYHKIALVGEHPVIVGEGMVIVRIHE